MPNYTLANDAGYLDVVYNPLIWTGTNSGKLQVGPDWKLPPAASPTLPCWTT